MAMLGKLEVSEQRFIQHYTRAIIYVDKDARVHYNACEVMASEDADP